MQHFAIDLLSEYGTGLGEPWTSNGVRCKVGFSNGKLVTPD